MYYRIEITPDPPETDSHSRQLQQRIIQFLKLPVARLVQRDVYSLFTEATETEVRKLADEIANPITQTWRLDTKGKVDWDWLIVIGFLPGVTDNVAKTLRSAARCSWRRELHENEQIYSSHEYLLWGSDLSRDMTQTIASGLLANPILHSIQIFSREEWTRKGAPVIRPEFDHSTFHRLVETIDLDGDDEALEAISRERLLALSLEEMRSIKNYFSTHGAAPERRQLGLNAHPTDVEVEILAQTWSEHCKHKIFAADIVYHNGDQPVEYISSLYKSYIKRSTFEIGKNIDWLVSVFSDNAGVIAFNDSMNLVYKVETHNSPSALDPYGGAITGIAGVNRDPMGTGMGAELLINLWSYCFASPFTDPRDVPAGLLHPRRIRDGVHAGVMDGGNQSGIPYGCGGEYFDERYIGKPLVFCGTIGKLPKTLNGRPSHEKDIVPGDLIVMAGGLIGRDGIHGATFSSEALTAGATAQLVQIGDPITQKLLYDFLIEARAAGWYRFLTDNGAGGLSCSIGEMAVHCGGCYVDLTAAPLKYPGLQPWEILLSESQERMTLAVPPDKIGALKELAARREVTLCVLGEFNASGKFIVVHQNETVACIDLDFVHNGCPRMRLEAVWEAPRHPEPQADLYQETNILADLLALMGRLNIASHEAKARQYDHEVKGLNVIKPFVGSAADVQSDATVFMAEPLAHEGIIVANAMLPRYSDIDTYHMTAAVIDLAIRRTIAVGGRLGHIAGVDNFCWPDPVVSPHNPDGKYKLAQLVRSNQALYDYTKAFAVPCISGKDSMKNDSLKGGIKISVPPTLLFSTIARMPEISKAVTLAAKFAGDLVYVIGFTKPELGGSEYLFMKGYVGNHVPRVDAASATAICQAVSQATDAELCHSIHAPALGGLAVGFGKIAIGGRLGLEIDLAALKTTNPMTPAEVLFSESCSRFIITIPPKNQVQFENLMQHVTCAEVGRVIANPVISFTYHTVKIGAIEVADLIKAYQGTFAEDQ